MPIDNFQRFRPSLVSHVYYRAHLGLAGKYFQNRSSQMDGKRYSEFGFCQVTNFLS